MTAANSVLVNIVGFAGLVAIALVRTHRSGRGWWFTERWNKGIRKLQNAGPG